MHRKVLDLGRHRARLRVSGIDRRRAREFVGKFVDTMGVAFGPMRSRLNCSQQGDVSSAPLGRPRDRNDGVIAEPKRGGCAWGRGTE